MRQFAGYILDLDGTVYLGERLVPGADRTVKKLRDRGARVVFVSNKPIQTRENYAQKLTRLGIPTDPDDVINSSAVLVEELTRQAPGARLYVVGEPPLVAELERAGFEMADDPATTDLIILAFDRTFHYGKLLFAHNAAKHGARIWATNPDRACPVEEGDIPDCASVIGALEGCTGKRVERIIGKPSPAVIHAAARRMGLEVSDCLLVGDALATDMRMARETGCACALVLTGVSRREILKTSPLQPDHILESIADLD